MICTALTQIGTSVEVSGELKPTSFICISAQKFFFFPFHSYSLVSLLEVLVSRQLFVLEEVIILSSLPLSSRATQSSW